MTRLFCQPPSVVYNGLAMTNELTLLITTDFHADKKALAGLTQLLDQTTYDAVIMAGDLINPDQRELPYVTSFINLIKKHQLPLFSLHGNNEPEEAYQLYREAGINIHLETKAFAGYNICGIGGYGYLNENGFADLSINNLIINEKTIFVTHVPPRVYRPTSLGPLVHLFGHLHVRAYAKQVGKTLLIQCPAGQQGKVTTLKLPGLETRFVELPKAQQKKAF